MNPLLRKILAAGRLTRDGKLAEAAAAVQRALAEPVGAGTHTAAMPAAQEIDEVIDVVEPAPAPASARQSQFLASSFTGAAGTRSFKLFVPAGRAGQALPLVVMLHGCTQDPDDFAAGTRMNALAEELGFLVLYPAQAPRSNAQKCWNWFSPLDQRRGSGEPALLAGMTRHAMQTHNVDPDRVYVAGLSAGGAMAAILAREYPELFAAAGVHSGIAPGSARDVQSAFAVMQSGPEGGAGPRGASAARGAPVIAFHGSADKTVAPANGAAVVAAALAGTGSTATVTSEALTGGGRPAKRSVWRDTSDPGAPSLAEHWLVQGAPHAWSGGAAAGSYTDPAGPDASREMLRFFLEHPRRP
jgi:poly(hydroxyalkanoate) depolymerase family esterase